jgi:hypothetical protein
MNVYYVCGAYESKRENKYCDKIFLILYEPSKLHNKYMYYVYRNFYSLIRHPAIHTILGRI